MKRFNVYQLLVLLMHKQSNYFWTIFLLLNLTLHDYVYILMIRLDFNFISCSWLGEYMKKKMIQCEKRVKYSVTKGLTVLPKSKGLIVFSLPRYVAPEHFSERTWSNKPII